MTDYVVSGPLAVWVAEHRGRGHDPYPHPTDENPERWECKCDPDSVWTAVWRRLTVRQINAKYAHLRKKVPPGSTVLDLQDGTVYQEPGKWGT